MIVSGDVHLKLDRQQDQPNIYQLKRELNGAIDSANRELDPLDPKNARGLDTPNMHKRNESSYSRNDSLIDMYQESPLPLEDQEEVAENEDATTKHVLKTNKLLDGDSNHLSDSTLLNTSFQFLNLSNPVSKKSSFSLQSSFITPVTKKSIPALLNSQFDPYGFKKTSNHHNFSTEVYNTWFKEYSQYLLIRKQKWLGAMKSSGLNSNEPTRFPPKSDKMKKIVRRGIPSEYRGQAWFFYAGGYEKLNKGVGVYEKIVEDTRNVSNKDTEVIERDLNRTFPDNKYFNNNLTQDSPDANSTFDRASETPMITTLRRVLIAFAHYQPQIGYCQSLNFLAGLLLLFMDEERTFWMLVILTERIIPKVHSANLEGVHTDQGVLMLCIKEYIPKLWSILGKNFDGHTLSEDKILTRLPPVTLVTSSWFMSVFVGVLPIEAVLRVWDILWYEGSKTIFRISLTILNMCLEKEEFNRTSKKSQHEQNMPEMEQIELFQFIQNYPKTLLNPNELIDNCFKKIGGYGFGSLSQDEINNCREFVSKQRAKLNDKKANGIATELTEEEKKTLLGNLADEDIHDVYGFNRGIMSGVAWNRNISNKMKLRFTRKPSR